MPSDGAEMPQLQRASTAKPPKLEPYYNYKPLPKGWIRLIEIHESPVVDPHDLEQGIHISLHDYPLSSCPPYIALSYSWGQTSPKVDPTTRVFTTVPRCYPFHCEGRLVLGTQNLRAALRRLRQAQYYWRYPQYDTSEQSTTVRKQYEMMNGTELFWIDAICIDQDDLAERSSQVMLMGQIYTETKYCMVWLGEKDTYTYTALELALRVYKDDNFRKSFNNHNIVECKRFMDGMLNRDTREELIALAVLFSRSWFSRLWVMQEASLARNVMIIVGSLFTELEVLLFLTQGMTLAQTFVFATTVVSSMMEELPIDPQIMAGSYTTTLTMLAYSRALLQRGESADFLRTLALTQKCNVTDPRDRIYGILAITAEFKSESDPIIQVDYELPAQLVYTNATSAVISRRNDLEVLSQVCAGKKLEGLPSWCPDYSSLEGRLHVLGGTDKALHQRPLWTCAPIIECHENRLLGVSGFLYDVVARAGKASTPGDQSKQSAEFLSIASVRQLLELAFNFRRSRPHSSAYK